MDPDEGKHVEGGTDAVKRVESAVERAVFDGGCVVDGLRFRGGGAEFSVIVGESSGFERPVHAEVPFSEAGGVVAGLVQ